MRSLNFPPWFPTYIEADARYFHTKAVALGFAWKVAMIERLIGDPRMESVWSELLKRKEISIARANVSCTAQSRRNLLAPWDHSTPSKPQLREAFAKDDLQTAEDFKLLEKSERDAVTEIAVSMRERFGFVKHNLTATIASVALERDTTYTKVREWTRPQRNSTPEKNSNLAKIPRGQKLSPPV